MTKQFTEETFATLANTFNDAYAMQPIRFTYRGFHCIIANFMGTPQGYLVFDRDSKFHRILADNPGVEDDGFNEAFLALPMDITFDEEREGVRVIGFDTNHSNDYSPFGDERFKPGHESTADDIVIRNAHFPDGMKIWTIYDVKDVLCDSIDMIISVFNQYRSHTGKQALAQLNEISF